MVHVSVTFILFVPRQFYIVCCPTVVAVATFVVEAGYFDSSATGHVWDSWDWFRELLTYTRTIPNLESWNDLPKFPRGPRIPAEFPVKLNREGEATRVVSDEWPNGRDRPLKWANLPIQHGEGSGESFLLFSRACFVAVDAGNRENPLRSVCIESTNSSKAPPKEDGYRRIGGGYRRQIVLQPPLSVLELE